ncbi:MAG: hypothetical protein HY717_20475 [Planctomycetes bacterium]|nr:hypothetical protein [Planctomycetota bacterium]
MKTPSLWYAGARRLEVRDVDLPDLGPDEALVQDDCFYQSIDLLEKGRIDLAPLVTHLAAPEEAQGLFEKGLAKSGGTIKGAIRWS